MLFNYYLLLGRGREGCYATNATAVCMGADSRVFKGGSQLRCQIVVFFCHV